MTTGVKIAIGCAVAAVALGVVTFAGLFGAAWWAKGKAEQFTGEQNRIEELQRTANANSFTPPPDGVIAEDRLLKFLEVRKRVFAVYEKHKDQLEAASRKEKADLGDVAGTFSFINDIRLAQAEAQADLGMSEDEYRFMVEQVYKTMWAAEVAKSTRGKSVSEAAGEAYDKAAQEMKKALEQARKAEDQAEEEGLKTDEKGAEETRESLEEGAKDLEKQAREVREKTREFDVPPANIALFRKHEAEIKKYAMSGLEWLGL